MSSPVWVLPVDLQTKTATFESGMASAARSARSAFGDIRSAAQDGAEGVVRGTTNMRAAIGLVDNTIRGNHAAAMADLIREFKDSSFVMAALPFAAVVGGIAAIAGIAIEVALKIKEWREEQQKLTDEQMKFGTAVQESFNSLDEKILQAELRADELRNDHLGALRKELQLIDHASMQDLVHEIETIAKAADPVFKMLEGHWYTWGIGSAGASHALEQFKTQYDALLSQGKDKEASDLLAGTLTSAKSILAAQQQAKANSGVTTNNPTDSARVQNAFQSAYVKLKAAGVEYTDKEIQSQQILIKALSDQVTAEGKIAELKKADQSNAKTQNSNEESGRRSEAARAAATSQLAIAQQTLAADKSVADARLDIQNASVAQRLASDLAFANRDLAIKQAANAQEIAALDKSGKDYQNQLKSLQEKEQELTAQHAATVAELQSRASVEQYKRDVTALEQSEREKIDATQQGSAARLAAIDAAIKEEAAHNLQAEGSYRALQTQRVQTVREMSQQEIQAKQQAIEAAAKVDEQSVQSQYRIAREQLQARGATIAQQAALALNEENSLFQIQQNGLQKELEALRQSGVAKVSEVQHIQQQIQTLTQTHENSIAEIQSQADFQREQEFKKAMAATEIAASKSLLSMLSGQKSFASEMSGLASSLTQNLISAALERMNQQKSQKLSDAETAASHTYAEVSGWPVVGPALAPALAAGAFSAVMAFATGTDAVPGVGNRDTVPAMLTPGEGVVPGGVMDGLRKMVRDGSMGGNGPSTTHIHVHYRPQIHAIDGVSVERMLDQHEDKFTKKFHSTVRKMNR